MAVEYIVNPEKRTVVAILKGTELDAHKAIVRQVGEADESFFGFNSNWTTLIPDCFVGKAKCDPRDEFSIDEGKKIAKARCMEKYYRAKDSAIKQWYKNACVKMKRVERLVKEIDTARLFSQRRKKAEAIEKYKSAVSALEEAQEELNKFLSK